MSVYMLRINTTERWRVNAATTAEHLSRAGTDAVCSFPTAAELSSSEQAPKIREVRTLAMKVEVGSSADGAQDSRKEVFVISPIGEDGSPDRKNADRFLNHIVRRALPEQDYVIRRADEEVSPYAITEAMLRRLLDAHFCVADITGLNANVMYELALAHAAGKKVITMTRDKGRPPFDIKDMRVFTYGFMWEEVEDAVAALKRMAEHEPEDPRFRDMFNPVTTAFRDLMNRQKAESEPGTPTEAFARMVENLERKVDQVIRVQAEDSRPQFGNPAVHQSEPGMTIVARANQNLVEYEKHALGAPNLGPQSRARHQMHLDFGRGLLNDVLDGSGDLARLDEWNDDTEHRLVVRRELERERDQAQ